MESREVMLTQLEKYLRKFPEDLLFRTKIIAAECLKTKQYLYYGPNKQQMRHGTYGLCFQIAENDNLIVYEGSWQHNLFQGQGNLFLISKPTAQQVFYKSSGEWKNAKLNGNGKLEQYCFSSHKWIVKYKGQFRDGQKHGLGEQYFEGNNFSGTFKDGCRDGRGRLTYKNGDFISGTFSKGLPDEVITHHGNLLMMGNSTQPHQVYDIGKYTQWCSFLQALHTSL